MSPRLPFAVHLFLIEGIPPFTFLHKPPSPLPDLMRPPIRPSAPFHDVFLPREMIVRHASPEFPQDCTTVLDPLIFFDAVVSLKQSVYAFPDFLL